MRNLLKVLLVSTMFIPMMGYTYESQYGQSRTGFDRLFESNTQTGTVGNIKYEYTMDANGAVTGGTAFTTRGVSNGFIQWEVGKYDPNRSQ